MLLRNSIYRYAVRYETRKRVSFANVFLSNCGALSECIVWSFRGRGPQNLRELMRETVRERNKSCDPKIDRTMFAQSFYAPNKKRNRDDRDSC